MFIKRNKVGFSRRNHRRGSSRRQFKQFDSRKKQLRLECLEERTLLTTFTMIQDFGGGKVAFGDLDNDGDTDMISLSTVWHNDGFGTFTDVQTEVGTSGVLGDYDNDGDLDFFSY